MLCGRLYFNNKKTQLALIVNILSFSCLLIARKNEQNDCFVITLC